MPEVGRMLGPAPRVPVSLPGQGRLQRVLHLPLAPGLQREWGFKAAVGASVNLLAFASVFLWPVSLLMPCTPHVWLGLSCLRETQPKLFRCWGRWGEAGPALALALGSQSWAGRRPKPHGASSGFLSPASCLSGAQDIHFPSRPLFSRPGVGVAVGIKIPFWSGSSRNPMPTEAVAPRD